MRRQLDHSMLEMALVGYNVKLDEVAQKIAEIERRLGIRRSSAPRATANAPAAEAAARPKRKLSAAGKRAIRAALKKRWAAFHSRTGAGKPAKAVAKRAKRTLSPAAKARLVANLAKARAAKARKRSAPGA